MKRHILWLLVGLLALALCVFGLKSCDARVSMPLIGANTQSDDSVQGDTDVNTDDNTNTDADTDAADAAAVDELIGRIGDPVTQADEDAITAARAAYDALSDAAKAKVTKLPELESAEAALAALQPAQEDGSQAGDSATANELAVGDTVTFIGGSVYRSSNAQDVTYERAESVCEVTMTNPGSAHPYHLISSDGGGVYGWVDVENIREGAGE